MAFLPLAVLVPTHGTHTHTHHHVTVTTPPPKHCTTVEPPRTQRSVRHSFAPLPPSACLPLSTRPTGGQHVPNAATRAPRQPTPPAPHGFTACRARLACRLWHRHLEGVQPTSRVGGGVSQGGGGNGAACGVSSSLEQLTGRSSSHDQQPRCHSGGAWQARRPSTCHARARTAGASLWRRPHPACDHCAAGVEARLAHAAARCAHGTHASPRSVWRQQPSAAAAAAAATGPAPTATAAGRQATRYRCRWGGQRRECHGVSGPANGNGLGGMPARARVYVHVHVRVHEQRVGAAWCTSQLHASVAMEVSVGRFARARASPRACAHHKSRCGRQHEGSFECLLGNSSVTRAQLPTCGADTCKLCACAVSHLSRGCGHRQQHCDTPRACTQLQYVYLSLWKVPYRG